MDSDNTIQTKVRHRSLSETHNQKQASSENLLEAQILRP